MTAAITVNLSATLDASSGAIAIGDVLIDDATTGEYVRATTVNRGVRRSHGVALSAWSSSTRGAVRLFTGGVLDASVSGLGVGTASWVRTSATGRLERCTPASGDDLMGKCDVDGNVFLQPGVWDSSNFAGGGGGGGGATLPIDMADPASVTGVLAAANGGTGSSSLPAGGIAGLTAMAAGDAAAQAAAEATAAAAIVTERSAARTLTNAVIAGASNTLTVRIANDVTGLAANMGTWLTTPSSANLLATLSDSTGTGLCVFATSPTFRTGILLNNPANTFAYTFTPAAIAAARTITLPLLTANDTMAVLAFAQTFTNKSLVLASNTITDTSQALGDIAYCNGTRFVRFARGATAGQSLTATATTIAYSSNPGVAAQAIAALAIDWTAGQVFTKTLAAGGNTFTFSNAASGMTIMVRLTGAASTVTWPTVRWAGGVAPTQTASGTDVYTFVHDGTNIYGSVVQAMA